MTPNSHIILSASNNPFDTLAAMLWQEKMIAAHSGTPSELLNLNLLTLDSTPETLTSETRDAINELHTLFSENTIADPKEHVQQISAALSKLYSGLVSTDSNDQAPLATLTAILGTSEAAQAFIAEHKKLESEQDANNGNDLSPRIEHIFSLFCKKEGIPSMLSSEEEQSQQRYCLNKDNRGNTLLLLNTKAVPDSYPLPEPAQDDHNPFGQYFSHGAAHKTLLGLGAIAAVIAALFSLFFGRGTKKSPKEKNAHATTPPPVTKPLIFSRKQGKTKFVSKTVMTSNKNWYKRRKR